MSVLQALHNWQFNSALALLFPTPFALACLVLFVWSLVFLWRPVVTAGFRWVTWACWALFLLPAVTGVLLALTGHKVPSAVAAAGTDATKYGFAPDPSRNWEHWMYSAFALLSLLLIPPLTSGRLFRPEVGARLVPAVTFFLYGVAYMIGRVAVFPGSTPGT